MYHIVSACEGLMINCLFYGNRIENLVAKERYLCFGDSFKIGEDCKFIKGVGWFLLINLNGKEEMFAQLESIENALNTKGVITMVELQIEISLLKYQLDQVLKKRKREEFYEVVNRYNGVNQLMNKIGIMSSK